MVQQGLSNTWKFDQYFGISSSEMQAKKTDFLHRVVKPDLKQNKLFLCRIGFL